MCNNFIVEGIYKKDPLINLSVTANASHVRHNDFQQPSSREQGLGRFHFLFLVSGIYTALLLTLRQLPCSICVPDCPKLSTQYHFGLMQQYCDIPRLYASDAVLKLIQSAICDLGCIVSPSLDAFAICNSRSD